MKKIKGSIALIILAVSWVALYWLTGSRTPWNNTYFNSDADVVSVHLGDIPSANYDRMGFTKAVVEYSEKADGWIVGTERGELLLFDNRGRQMWKRSLGIGKMISLAISNDGATAFVGEQSPEGKIYAVDAVTGDIKWQRKGTDYVGAEPSKRSYPAVVHLAVDEADNVYANIYRYVMNKDSSRLYVGRTVSINSNGEERWRFPAEENLDSWVNWCDVSKAQKSVVLSTSVYESRSTLKYGDTMYFLDKENGKMSNSVFVKEVPPFENTVMRGSPNFSADGNYLAAACSDGRAFLFDGGGKELWMRIISKPTQVDSVWINASGRDGYVTEHGVLFTTINTFNRENWQLPTPIEHPGDNSIFMFALSGEFKYQYRAEGTIEKVSFTDKLLAGAVGRNVRTHNYKAHGAFALELDTGKLLRSYVTEGPVQAIAISKDGSRMAGVETPAVTPQGNVIGAHRLHIWNTR